VEDVVLLDVLPGVDDDAVDDALDVEDDDVEGDAIVAG